MELARVSSSSFKVQKAKREDEILIMSGSTC
jgi:hypothetical protein